MTTYTGRCLCGAVSFAFSAEPMAVRICWCRDCQHLAGNGTVNLTVPAESLTVSGAVAEHVKTADSGNQLTRQFCPTCGTHLFGLSSGRPHLRVVRVGNLDDPSSVTPTINIWTDSAPAWACLDASLDNVPGQPQPPAPR